MNSVDELREYENKTLNFGEFKGTQIYIDDPQAMIEHDAESEGSIGIFSYDQGWISVCSAKSVKDLDMDGVYHLNIGQSEWSSDDLSYLERVLWLRWYLPEHHDDVSSGNAEMMMDAINEISLRYHNDNEGKNWNWAFDQFFRSFNNTNGFVKNDSDGRLFQMRINEILKGEFSIDMDEDIDEGQELMTEMVAKTLESLEDVTGQLQRGKVSIDDVYSVLKSVSSWLGRKLNKNPNPQLVNVPDGKISCDECGKFVDEKGDISCEDGDMWFCGTCRDEMDDHVPAKSGIICGESMVGFNESGKISIKDVINHFEMVSGYDQIVDDEYTVDCLNYARKYLSEPLFLCNWNDGETIELHTKETLYLTYTDLAPDGDNSSLKGWCNTWETFDEMLNDLEVCYGRDPADRNDDSCFNYDNMDIRRVR